MPSGLKWATTNIGAENPWDLGYYFSWGNIIGHNLGGPATGEYSFDATNYASTPGYQLSADISQGSVTYDAASYNIGSPWRMPTKEEFQELYDYADIEWVSDYHGVAGRKFMNKNYHNKFIFLPLTGYYDGSSSLGYQGSYGLYWSSSYNSSTNAYDMYFNSSSVNPQWGNKRYDGLQIRPVK